MYESENFKCTVRVNKQTKHMKITETTMKLVQFCNDWL